MLTGVLGQPGVTAIVLWRLVCDCAEEGALVQSWGWLPGRRSFLVLYWACDKCSGQSGSSSLRGILQQQTETPRRTSPRGGCIVPDVLRRCGRLLSQPPLPALSPRFIRWNHQRMGIKTTVSFSQRLRTAFSVWKITYQELILSNNHLLKPSCFQGQNSSSCFLLPLLPSPLWSTLLIITCALALPASGFYPHVPILLELFFFLALIIFFRAQHKCHVLKANFPKCMYCSEFHREGKTGIWAKSR